MTYQICIVEGKLGNTPELRYTPQGKAVTDFSIADNQRVGDKEYVTWFKVTAWEKTAENACQYLRKGDKVLVAGRVSVRAYTNKNQEAAASLELRADRIDYIQTSGTSSGNSRNSDTSEQDRRDEIDDQGDIPF